jgi:hypothetical protein
MCWLEETLYMGVGVSAGPGLRGATGAAAVEPLALVVWTDSRWEAATGAVPIATVELAAAFFVSISLEVNSNA